MKPTSQGAKAVYNGRVGDHVLLSIRSQVEGGSAEEKLEYEIQNLMATPIPAAMLVYGPARGRDGEEGWREHVLRVVWERAKPLGANRVYLVRSAEKFSRWLEGGPPVAGRGRTAFAMSTSIATANHEPTRQ
jgi:hypothetical protein